MRQAAAWVLAAAACLPTAGASQVAGPGDAGARPGAIAGHVIDERGEGLQDVAVTLSAPGRLTTLSDGDGRFVLFPVEPGEVEVRFTRLGYASHTVAVGVAPGDTARIDAVLSMEAIELDPIAVSVGPRFLERNGFFRRSRSGFGRQFSREQLDELRMLEVSDAVRRIPGVWLEYDSHMANRVLATRPGRTRLDMSRCALTVYIDGVRTLDPNLNQIPPDWLLAMEVYLGAHTPAKYRTGGSCGVVLLWTKQS